MQIAEKERQSQKRERLDKERKQKLVCTNINVLYLYINLRVNFVKPLRSYDCLAWNCAGVVGDFFFVVGYL